MTETVLSLLEQQAALACSQETGGIIGGSGSVEEGAVLVSHATDGGPAARSGPASFSRDTSYCQRIADAWARHSGGNVDYLGEWHKHFEEDPAPSTRDLRTLGAIAQDRNYHVSSPLLLIIGSCNRRSSLRVFLIDEREQYVRIDWRLSGKTADM